MTLTLHIQTERWRAHLAAVIEQSPGLVPVVKGNGYGFGRELALAEVTSLGAPAVAVGTYAEAAEALETFTGDIQVLSPWRPGQELAHERLVHTVSRVSDIEALATVAPGARAYLEGGTSMLRHGMTLDELRSASVSELQVEGLSVHLPLPDHNENLAEAELWADAYLATGLTPTLSVSHLTPLEVAALDKRHPELTVRPRVGTALWLGDLSALSVTATVLDTHPVRRGQRTGYRQQSFKSSGHLVIVGAGTSNGVGLDAPKASISLTERGKSVARGSLEAVGWARSPFVIDGKQRWFAEPPHMHHSMVMLPSGAAVPAVGDEVTARIRYTTTTVDAVSFE